MFRDEVSGTGMQAPSEEATRNKIGKGVPATCSDKNSIEGELYCEVEEM